jgi:hypothetical protein
MNSSPWMSRGIFRVEGDPNLVQVQLGRFFRPFTKRDYQAAGYRPPLEELPWKGKEIARSSPLSRSGKVNNCFL